MAASSPLQRHTSRDALLRAVIRACMKQIEPEIRAFTDGSQDPERVHRLRVEIRRLRTAIREMGELVPEAGLARWEPALAETFRALGVIRDRDVITATLGPLICEATGIDDMPWNAPAVEPVTEALRYNAFLPAMAALERFAASPCPSPAGAEPRQRDRWLRCRLRRLHRSIVHAGHNFCSQSPETQHRIRKRLKRMRHLIEFLATLLRRRDTQAYLHRIQPALDALSLHQDTLTALSMLGQARRAGDPHAEAATQWLETRLRRTARRSQRALRRVERAPRFWKQLRS